MEKKYVSMKEVTDEDYKNFLKKHREVTIENVELRIGDNRKIEKINPEIFIPESTTVWSFPNRGDWATHNLNPKYRGNWAPQVPRNLILKYLPEPKKNDIVLDQMVGSGTTLIECKLLGINAIGIDINPDAVMVTRDRLNFSLPLKHQKSEQKTYIGDARNLNLIDPESISLIATHPPYASIISYSNERIEGDLSRIRKIDEFIEEIGKFASESFRILKPGRHCAVLMGDTRRHQHYIPITVRMMQAFLDVGFILREDIIKLQHNMKSTRERWRGSKYLFYKIAHEHLFVFRKPMKDEKISEFKESMKWW